MPETLVEPWHFIVNSAECYPLVHIFLGGFIACKKRMRGPGPRPILDDLNMEGIGNIYPFSCSIRDANVDTHDYAAYLSLRPFAETYTAIVLVCCIEC